MDPARLEDWVTIHDHLVGEAPEAAAQGIEAHPVPEACGSSLQGAVDGGGERALRAGGVGGPGTCGLPRKGGVRVRRQRGWHALLLLERVRPSRGAAGSPGRAAVARATAKEVDGSLQRLKSLVEVTVSPLLFSLMADFLDEKRSEIDARLQRAEAAGGRSTGDSRRPPRPSRESGPTAGRPATRRRPAALRGLGAPDAAGRGGSGAGSKQALELVRTRPGITISELADTMGIKANYLYRVMPSLASEGKVVKRGKGWHPA